MGERISYVGPPLPADLEKWIKWILEQPAGSNPGEDTTGEAAAQDQGKEDVWFLPGGYGNGNSGTIIRKKVKVPARQPILIISASSDGSLAEHEKYGLNPNDPQIDSKLKQIAYAVANKHQNVELTIATENASPAEKISFNKNGQKPSEKLELIETTVIPLIFPKNNVYNGRYGEVKGGLTRLACVAWGVKVRLEPGEYTVTLKANHPKDTVTAGGITFEIPEFNLDIKYENLTAISGFKTTMFA